MKTPGALGILVRSLAVVFSLASSLPALAQEQEETRYPETTGEALRVFEESVSPDDWVDGPVQYIMLDYERELWDSLRVEAEQEAFQRWFWDRRDPDPRDDDHEIRESFYERVAYANQRFHGFPRGWRSDRGRVYVILGTPTGGMRRTSLASFGRCAAREGEWWTYFTGNMAFQSTMGEFHVIFVEVRVGQFEICEPTMLGVGAWPLEVRRAFEITNEAMVIDTVTEFDATPDLARRSAGALPVREVEAGVEPLTVPADAWGLEGVAGTVVVPVEIPLRDLLFEPVGDVLRATLRVEASLVAMGEQEGRAGEHEWQLELGVDESASIGAASLRTAVVLPAEPGGYGASVRIVEPLSGRVLTWEGAVEIAPDGSAVSPLLVGGTLVQLRDSGEVAVIGPDRARLTPGEPFAAMAWVRGAEVNADDVGLTLIAADGTESDLADVRIAWGNQAAAGPLVVEATLPAVAPGRYVLRLDPGGGLTPVEAVVEVE